jgi:hypothetical protein
LSAVAQFVVSIRTGKFARLLVQLGGVIAFAMVMAWW